MRTKGISSDKASLFITAQVCNDLAVMIKSVTEFGFEEVVINTSELRII